MKHTIEIQSKEIIISDFNPQKKSTEKKEEITCGRSCRTEPVAMEAARRGEAGRRRRVMKINKGETMMADGGDAGKGNTLFFARA